MARKYMWVEVNKPVVNDLWQQNLHFLSKIAMNDHFNNTEG
jgi:hypothetical protein